VPFPPDLFVIRTSLYPKDSRGRPLVWELIAPSFIYTLVKDVLSLVKGKRRRPTAAEIVQLRQKWKPIFESNLWERRRDKLNSDVIIHDVKRLDQYPHGGNEGKGISAWFRVGLMGTYHGGILVGLSWETLNRLPDGGWRLTDYSANETGELKVILIGEVPYERIEGVDWDGDEYYGFPHLYCHFDGPSRQPYQRLVYCEQRHLNDVPFYVDVALAEEVRRATMKHNKKK
jgi:hypothetical protein